jgi:hypothetical protein
MIQRVRLLPALFSVPTQRERVVGFARFRTFGAASRAFSVSSGGSGLVTATTFHVLPLLLLFQPPLFTFRQIHSVFCGHRGVDQRG